MSNHGVVSKIRLGIIAALTASSCMVGTVYADSLSTVCYGIADNDRFGDEDVLVRMFTDGTTVEVGAGKTGTLSIEGTTFDIKGELLYAADGGQLGTLDLETAVFTPIGNGFGTANGAEGLVELNDVDGLTFHHATGNMYGIHRREHQKPVAFDLLFQIDPYTGKFVPGVFVGGHDYVVVGGDARQDVDDIASDPEDGTLYIVSNDGDGVNSMLAKLEVVGGIPTGKAIHIGNNNDDIESLTFSSEPEEDSSYTLYGTTGDGGANKNNDPSNRHRLFKINKKTGAASPVGQLLPPAGDPQKDYEAVSCRTETGPGTCLMYALHDEGQYDSQVIEIDPFAGHGVGSVKPLGPFYPTLDIEGLALVDTTGKLYGTSGGDQECVQKPKLDANGNQVYSSRGTPTTVCETDANGNIVYLMPQGALYEIDRKSGALRTIGAPDYTGYFEVSALAYNQVTDEVWGWATGGMKVKPITEAGPIRINPVTGKAELDMEFPYKSPIIQGAAFSNDGKILYVSEIRRNDVDPHGTYLWEYNLETKKLSESCPGNPIVSAEVEALEMQPNDLLLLAAHDRTDIGIIAVDPKDCSVKATRIFSQVTAYYDLESIEWPAKECDYRSWLYETSGDAEIIAFEYTMVPDDVEEAIRLALGDASNIAVENEGGEVKIYVGNQRFIVRPAIYGGDGPRSGARSGADCAVVEASLSDDFRNLAFTDCTGREEVWKLNPISFNSEALLNALNQVGRAQVSEDGNVTLNLRDGTVIKAVLSLEVQAPQVAAGQAIQPATSTVATIAPLADVDGNGLADYAVTYPTGHKQILLVSSIKK